jgi:hypothetical protein
LIASTIDSNEQRLGANPVAFIVFNRPDHTRRTFEAIRRYRPSQLFVIADGPRAGHPTDADRCRAVRRLVSEIDWPCEVRRDFSEVNLGCKQRVSSGLNWVFSIVERAIIIEDDCLASPDFFSFCDELLPRYESNEAVWVVSGNNYQDKRRSGDASYYFSKYPDIWGWATWRRAWHHYRGDMPFLEEWVRSPRWKQCFPTRSERRYFLREFSAAASGELDSWGYPWMGCVIHGGGLSATPNVNLVKNIGFDAEATRTKLVGDFAYDLGELGRIKHARETVIDREADDSLRRKFYTQVGLPRRLFRRAVRVLYG